MDDIWNTLLAHRADNEVFGKSQYLSCHLKNTAERAGALGREIGLESMCMLIGLLHDAGKANPVWQKYIRGEMASGGDHAGVGACYVQYILYEYAENFVSSDTYQWYGIYNEFLVYPILAHHGLYDVLKEMDDGTVCCWTEKRLKENKRLISEQKELKFFMRAVDDWAGKWFKTSLFQLYQKGFSEWMQWYKNIDRIIRKSGQAVMKDMSKQREARLFYFGATVRLLTGILKEADVYDSANWYLEEKQRLYEEKDLHAVWQQMGDKVENLYEQFRKAENPSLLNQIRTAMADNVYAAAVQTKCGSYKLSLPVGAGKTNASLRYALHHARTFHDRRIIYTTAFLSVLEQNAKDIQDIIGSEYVLEHHSNVVASGFEGEEGEYEGAEYLRESWESPIILTTLVQLSNTLFKGQSACLRRFSKLVRSVIIIDEIQSLPVTCVHLYNLMMNFLTQMMGVTIIHCTATPPGLDDEKVLTYSCIYEKDEYGSPVDLVDAHLIESPVFMRAHFYSLLGSRFTDFLSTDQLVAHVMTQLETEKSALIIVNTKKAVRKIYDAITNWLDEHGKIGECWYLTTNLCAAHRLERITSMKAELQKLRDGARQTPLICVSTNLIAAGVNIDFDVVYRSLTSLDGVLQAGGRCNRDGKRKNPGRVYLFMYADETLERMIVLQKEREASLEALRKVYGTRHEDEKLDIAACLDEYFQRLYDKNRQSLDYPVQEGPFSNTLLQMLSENRDMVAQYNIAAHPDGASSFKHFLRQRFKTAADAFQLIDNKEKTVIVPYKNEDLLDEVFALIGDDGHPDFSALKPVLQKLQRYTVGMYDQKEYVQVIPELGIYLLDPEGYDETFGLTKGEWSELIF